MSAVLVPPPMRTDRDAVFGRDARATIALNAIVQAKADASAPALPMAGALVRLHDRFSGRIDWQGLSDVTGAYHASDLVPGAEYIPVGIDLARTFAAVAGGPVLAQRVPRVVPDVITAHIGQPLTQSLQITGATGAAVARIKSGSLPSGVSYSVRDGFYATWPTGAAGDYPIVMEITDASGTREQPVTVRNVLLPLAITLQDVSVRMGEAMSPVTIGAAGGEGPYTISMTAGSLPSGVSFDGAAQVVSGTPTVLGQFSATFTAVDLRGASASRAMTLRVIKSVAYRYWRLDVSANNGNAFYCTVAELALLDVSGVDVTSSASAEAGAATASSFANSSNRPSLAFDKLASSKWTSSTTTGWLQYDCGATTTIASMRLIGQYSNGDQATMAPKDFTLRGSDAAGGPWTTVITRTGQTAWGAAEVREYLID